LKQRLEIFIPIRQNLPREFDFVHIETLEDNDWRKLIVEYLRNCGNTNNKTLKYRVNSYIIINYI